MHHQSAHRLHTSCGALVCPPQPAALSTQPPVHARATAIALRIVTQLHRATVMLVMHQPGKGMMMAQARVKCSKQVLMRRKGHQDS